ncbi:hypothetical protein [Bacillus sp. NPDC077027]|uniref:hypothetical protein n=1 Tax=Bacillus sp. NPDC077027 TaxID=3390548 RepID=UPI003D03F1F2
MRKFIFCLATIILLSNGTFTAQATDETNQAIELERHKGFRNATEVKTTIVDEHDSRLYKVSLGMNSTEKLTLRSSKTFDVKITSPNGEIITQRTGIGRNTLNDEGVAQVEFPTDTVGNYFISIKSSNDNKNQFPYELNVAAGTPVLYPFDIEKKISLNRTSITSFNKTSSIQYFDLTNEISIPDHSYITEVRTDGPDSGRNLLSLYTLKRSIRPDSNMTWFNTTYPNFTLFPAGYPNGAWIPVKQRFAFRISASTFYQPGTYTIDPTIYIVYRVELK